MKTTITPTSIITPAALKLIEQIRAEAEEDTLTKLSSRDDMLFLRPLEKATKTFHFTQLKGGVTALEIEDGTGTQETLYKRFVCPDGWMDWHPAYWDNHSTRIDNLGKRWTHHNIWMVIDDFGTLVPVEGGAQ